MFRMEVFSSRIRATEAKIAGIETITAVPSIPRITDSCILKSLMKFHAFPAARISLPLASALAALLAAPLANAAVYYWDSDSTTAGFGNVAGTWGTSAFWNTLADGTGATANTTITSGDAVNFGTSTLGLGSTAATIGIVAGGVTTNSISFGSAQSNAVTLSSGGGIITLAGTTPTITVNNSSDTIAAVVAGTAGMTKAGTGTLVLTASNTFSGATNINAGTLDLSGSGSILNSAITLRGGTLTLTNTAAETGSGRIHDSNTVTSNGGTLSYNNTSGANVYAETIGSVDLTSGQLNVVLANNQAGGGSQTLTLSGLTHTGATNTSAVAFASAGGLNITTNRILVSGASGAGAGQNGPGGVIIGPWATAGTSASVQTDYAVYDASGYVLPANITASAETTWTTAANAYTLGTSGTTLTASRTITALRYTGAADAALALGANNLETYGILNGNSGNANRLTVSGTGVVRTPTGGGNLYLTTNASTVATAAYGLSIGAPITNAAGGGATTVVKNGASILVLTSGSSSFTGGLVINQGLVWATLDGAMGASSGGITFNGTSTLVIGFGGSSARAITVNNGAVAKIINDSGIASWTNSGAVTGNGGISIEAPLLASNGQTYNSGGEGSVITLSSTSNNFTGPVGVGAPVIGSGGFATLTLSSLTDSASPISFGLQTGAQTFNWGASAGALVLNQRQIQLLGTTQGGILNNNATAPTSTITINTDLLVTGVGAKTLTLGGSNTGNNTFAGKIGDSSSGATRITKAGAGKWILSGANTYSGTTAVNAGKLTIASTGTINSTSGLTISGATANFNYNSSTAYAGGAITFTQGTISGTGTINKAITVGANAIVSPGNSPGIQIHSAGETWSNGGTYLWEVNNWTGTTAGTDFDQLQISGANLNISGLTSGAFPTNTFKIDINGLTAGNSLGAVPNFSAAVSRTWDIATYTGLTGTFNANLFTLDTTNFTGSNNIGGGTFSLTNAAGVIRLNFTPGAGAFWSGATDGDWGTLNNWNTSATSNVAVGTLPSSASDVHFSTTTPVPGNLGAVNLAADFAVKTLAFDAASTATTIGSSGGFTLTITPTLFANGINVDTTAGDNTLTTKVALGADQTWTVGTGRTLTASNVVSGNFALTKAGAGTLTLSGSNTYGGTTTVSAGTLTIANALALQNSALVTTGAANSVVLSSVTTPTIGGLSGAVNLATFISGYTGVTALTLNPQTAVSVTYGGVISNGSGAMTLTKSGAGTQTLSASNTYTGGTTVSAGTLSGSNLVSFGTGTIALGASGTLQLTTAQAGGGHSLGIADPYYSDGWINTVTGSGTISIVSASASYSVNYSGDLTGFTGTLSTSAASGQYVGYGSNNSPSFTVNLSGGNTKFVVNGAGTFLPMAPTGGKIVMGELSGNGNISTPFGKSMTYEIGALSTNSTFSGVLTQNSAVLSLTKVGTGALTLSGTNINTGTTTVSAGTLQFAKRASLYNNTPASWTAANINVKSGATLALNVDSAGTAGFTSASLNTLLTNISVAGSTTTGLQSGAILGFDTGTATAGTFTQGNLIANSTGGSGGAIGVTKLGGGTLVFDKANTYTGATTVSAGILAVNGSLANTTTTVQNTATLQGSGSIGGSVTIQNGGKLAAGNSIESLATGALSLQALATFAQEINNDAAATVAGDLTAVTGNLTLDLANTAILTLTELGSGSWSANEKLTLISYSGTWNGGLFNYGGTLADDSTINFSGATWQFNYNDTVAGSNYTSDLTGTNFVTMTVVPEPNVAALFGSFGILALLRRRR